MCVYCRFILYQELLGGGAGDREEVFEALVKEKARVDHLNVHQLLRRDLKVLILAFRHSLLMKDT